MKIKVGSKLPIMIKVSLHDITKRMTKMTIRPNKVLMSIDMFWLIPFLTIVMSEESLDKNSPIFQSSKKETSLWTILPKTSLLKFLEILSLTIEKHQDQKNDAIALTIVINDMYTQYTVTVFKSGPPGFTNASMTKPVNKGTTKSAIYEIKSIRRPSKNILMSL